MTRRGWMVGVIALGLGLVLGWWILRDWTPPARVDAVGATDAKSAGSAAADRALSPAARAKILRDAPEAHLADALNRPDGTLREDVAIVGSLIAAYRSNYAGRGNPIGDNREITDTLLGANPNGIIFLQAGHPAINAKGELCDRWGTPFHFHAESGRKMEVRSAGPDRKMWTADDVFLVP